jgi:hydrophobic/amphiphilic exporter-1 (mainly G- bacteria), HAE1 family
VTVEFNDSADLDVAATDLRDAVARVQNSLPDGAEAPRVVKADADSDAILRIAVTSPRRSAEEPDAAGDRSGRKPPAGGPRRGRPADLRRPGLVFRVDVDLMQLAARGLSLADLRAALGDVAFDAPAGSLSLGPQQPLGAHHRRHHTPRRSRR